MSEKQIQVGTFWVSTKAENFEAVRLSDFNQIARECNSQADQLAALREELARCSSGHTNLVDRNALLRQRPDLPSDRIPAHEKLIDLQQRLADAERRNASMVGLLHRALAVIRDEGWNELEADIIAALNKPEEAKS